MKFFAAFSLLLASSVFAAPPRDASPVDASALPSDYRLHVEFSGPAGGAVRLGKDISVPLRSGAEVEPVGLNDW